MARKIIRKPKGDEYLKSKNYERKINSLFRIFVSIESILVLEGDGYQDQNWSYTKKC